MVSVKPLFINSFYLKEDIEIGKKHLVRHVIFSLGSLSANAPSPFVFNPGRETF